MKKISFLFPLLTLAVLAGCGQQPPANNDTPDMNDDQNDQQVNESAVEVQNEYESKVVYVNPGSDADWAPYQQDCEAREGTFVECGNGCAPDADFCASVCTPVCDLMDGGEEAKNEWESFTSKGIGITVAYPPAAEIDQEPATSTVSFRMQGPTQAEGTELFDGLSVTIQKDSLPAETTLRDYVEQQAEQDQDIGEITEEVSEVTIGEFSGFSYQAQTLGQFTKIFLPHGTTEVVSISYMAPDPTNAGYQEMVDKMLESLSMHSIRQTPSTDS